MGERKEGDQEGREEGDNVLPSLSFSVFPLPSPSKKRKVEDKREEKEKKTGSSDESAMKPKT